MKIKPFTYAVTKRLNLSAVFEKILILNKLSLTTHEQQEHHVPADSVTFAPP